MMQSVLAESGVQLEDVQRIVVDDTALIPVFHSSAVSVGRAGLEGYAVHPAETVHVDGGTSYVRLRELPPGANLVTGTVDTPVEGMSVRERLDAEGPATGEGADGRGGDAEPPRAAATARPESAE